jgi:GNAT superfamily N-acetyltransferase
VYKGEVAEIKDVCQSEDRGKGIASKILKELESWAEKRTSKAVFWKPVKIPEAIALIENGFHITSNYGQ